MNETPIGPVGSTHGGGHRLGSGEECSPLQTRAAFLKNWGWESVVGINQRACARGGSQHGINSETGAASERLWREKHTAELSLLDVFELLRNLHRSAPFLFLNGNTFSSIGRELCLALFSDLQPVRKRELASAVAHYIAGVLDRELMIAAVDSLCASAALAPGDRVQTLRGSTHGTITRVLEDGRVAWQPDGATLELIALPESLTALSKP